MNPKNHRPSREGVDQPKPRVPPHPETPPPPISQQQLITFGERVTYTFASGREIGSIHYDRLRGEIFYKGHSVRHMELNEGQAQMLEKMRLILQNDPQTRRFAEGYGKTLDKIIVERAKDLTLPKS